MLDSAADGVDKHAQMANGLAPIPDHRRTHLKTEGGYRGRKEDTKRNAAIMDMLRCGDI